MWVKVVHVMQGILHEVTPYHSPYVFVYLVRAMPSAAAMTVFVGYQEGKWGRVDLVLSTGKGPSRPFARSCVADLCLLAHTCLGLCQDGRRHGQQWTSASDTRMWGFTHYALELRTVPQPHCPHKQHPSQLTSPLNEEGLCGLSRVPFEKDLQAQVCDFYLTSCACING